eukprot:5926276-Prymnesium_polylepis.2
MPSGMARWSARSWSAPRASGRASVMPNGSWSVSLEMVTTRGPRRARVNDSVRVLPVISFFRPNDTVRVDDRSLLR